MLTNYNMLIIFYLFSYLVSFIIVSLFGLYYLQYTERSHMRERARILGQYIYSLITCPLYDNYISYYVVQILLILSDIFSGLIEGILNLQPMIKLYIPKPIIVTKIEEKIIE